MPPSNRARTHRGEAARSSASTSTSGAASQCEHEAVLVVSELVTNVVRHAHTDIHLHAEWNAVTLRVEVRDGSSVLPAIADLEDEHGQGLRLVQQLASAWGVEQRDDGKAVWFTVNAPSASPA